MRELFAALLLSCAFASPLSDVLQRAILQTKLDKGVPANDVFTDFKRLFDKKYKDETEEKNRKSIFQSTVEYILAHNKLYARGEKSYNLAINQFSDLTHEEFLHFYTGSRFVSMPKNGSTFIPPFNVWLPPTVDWRYHNYVTPVKNQGRCGSCWAFSTTGSVEGQYARKYGNLVSLSEQQLVDCSSQNHGCNGGFQELAFEYIKAAGGLQSEKSYPYHGKDESCKFLKSAVVPGTRVSGYKTIRAGSEDDLQQAVATQGPVSVSIDATQPTFMSYSSGVYDEPKCSSWNLNHAVLAIGYGFDPKDYWLVKNSWGNTWGESGYIRMSRNKGDQCGIASEASYPDL